jgi:hypothetical protein
MYAIAAAQKAVARRKVGEYGAECGRDHSVNEDRQDGSEYQPGTSTQARFALLAKAASTSVN